MENSLLFERRVFLYFCHKNNITPQQLEQAGRYSFKTALRNTGFSWMEAFDLLLHWARTEEGYKFWYYNQMDYVKFLIVVAKKNNFPIDRYRAYLQRLLEGYGRTDYGQDAKFSELCSFYRSC